MFLVALCITSNKLSNMKDLLTCYANFTNTSWVTCRLVMQDANLRRLVGRLDD